MVRCADSQKSSKFKSPWLVCSYLVRTISRTFEWASKRSCKIDAPKLPWPLVYREQRFEPFSWRTCLLLIISILQVWNACLRPVLAGRSQATNWITGLIHQLVAYTAPSWLLGRSLALRQAKNTSLPAPLFGLLICLYQLALITTLAVPASFRGQIIANCSGDSDAIYYRFRALSI